MRCPHQPPESRGATYSCIESRRKRFQPRLMAISRLAAPHASEGRWKGYSTSLVLFVGVSRPCRAVMTAVLAQGQNCFCGARPSGAGQACPAQAQSDGALPSASSSETSCTRLRLLFRLLPVHHQHLLGCQAGPWLCSGAVDQEHGHQAGANELHRPGCMPSLQWGDAMCLTPA